MVSPTDVKLCLRVVTSGMGVHVFMYPLTDFLSGTSSGKQTHINIVLVSSDFDLFTCVVSSLKAIRKQEFYHFLLTARVANL